MAVVLPMPGTNLNESSRVHHHNHHHSLNHNHNNHHHHPSLRPRKASSASSSLWVSTAAASTSATAHVGDDDGERLESAAAAESPTSSTSDSSASPQLRASGSTHVSGSGSASHSQFLLNEGSLNITVKEVHRTRRPRRRADEVERLYKCTWNGCEKSYGTLSHLNDHVRLQRHGNKREPHEFKEARRIWRQERKSRRLREHALHAANAAVTADASTPDADHEQDDVHVPSRVLTLGMRSYSPHSRRVAAAAAALGSLAAAAAGAGSHHEFGVNQDTHLHSYTHRHRSNSNYILNPPGSASSATAFALTPIASMATSSTRHSPDDHEHDRDDSESLEDAQRHPGATVRLPSIAELRLDLSLEDFERLEQQSTSGVLIQPPSTRIRQRRRDSETWGSPPPPPHSRPSSSANVQQKYHPYTPQQLAPPPPFHAYQPPSSSHDTGSPLENSPSGRSPEQYRFHPVLSPASPLAGSATSYPFPPHPHSHSRHTSSQSHAVSRPSTAQSYPFIPATVPRGTPDTSEGEPRRKRRRYEEIERRYACGWEGCTKAYGTLNHLNDHVSLQNHGPKRKSSEFT